MSYRTWNDYGQKTEEIKYKVMSVQSREHRNELIKNNGILCIKVSADWCEPCKQIAPEYSRMAKTYISKGQCLCVDEDLENGIGKVYKDITAVPTFLIFYRSELFEMIQGANLDSVRQVIDGLINETNQVPQTNNTAPSGHSSRGNIPLYRSNYGQNPHPERHPSFQNHSFRDVDIGGAKPYMGSVE